MIPKIHLYTDGASSGNPGPGGYGLILEWVGKSYYKESSQAFKYTTNNRMELLAVIEGLAMLKTAPCEVVVFSDSRYVVDTVTKGWLFQWEKKSFNNKKNPDLWKRFVVLYRKHRVTFQWIKGHNNHPQNERCDKMAVEAYKNGPWLEDFGFEAKA